MIEVLGKSQRAAIVCTTVVGAQTDPASTVTAVVTIEALRQAVSQVVPSNAKPLPTRPGA